MKAVIYVRVSRQDQDYQRQISDLKAVASAKHWDVAEIITEKISGAKTKRAGIECLLDRVRSGEVKKVMVTEVSRLGRNTLQVLQIIETLTELNISVYIHNFGIETLQENGKKNPMVSMMLTILAEFATMERENLIDRTKSGLAHAKKNGVKLGRPVDTKKSNEKLLEEYKPIVKYLKARRSIREIAKLTDVAPNTVLKVKKAFQQFAEA
jgi:DNA invertase Pin-like site-specific DNA recombinase